MPDDHSSADDFPILDQYESLEEPEYRAEYLLATGHSLAYIETLRRMRDAARRSAVANAGEESQESAVPPGSSRTARLDRSARRHKLRSQRRTARTRAATRPPNRTAHRNRTRRTTRRTRITIIIIDLL